MKVLVAGAGLAGLTAARALARRGVAVTVLDARDRLGGRVWTARSRSGNGTHGELGGEFIDADQRHIRQLCDELGLRLRRVTGSGFTHRFRSNDGHYRLSRDRPWAELAQLLEPLREKPRQEVARFSLRDWLRHQHAAPVQHSMADALRGFFLADPDEISVLALVEQIANGGSPARGERYCIDGGNDRLVAALAREIPRPVLLRHRLTAIAQRSEGVAATIVDESGTQQQLEADAIVVTLPASTLAGVEITPPLPDDQTRAVRTLRYGCATKVLIETERDPFRGRARAFATDTTLGAFWQTSERMLTFLSGGSASRPLRTLAERGARAVLDELCWLELNDVGADVMSAATWEDDPLVRGGYAYFDPTFDPDLRPLLGRSAGRIHFAGEHTSERWQGYMNGAVETALRAVSALGFRL